MVEDQGKEEEKFDFTGEGEAVGYISLAQARLLAMQTEGETPGNYGRRYQNVPMFFESVEDSENEDYYVVTLSFRPQGDFSGIPGQEQFFIEKEGTVARRQVLSLPRGGGGRRFPVSPIAIGLVVVGVIVAVAAVFVLSGSGDGGEVGAVPAPTEIPVPVVVPIPPTDTPKPLLMRKPTYTPTPTTAAPMSESSFSGTHGTIVVNDSATFNIGSGRFSWSGSGTQTGYFYTGSPTGPNPVLVAGVTPASDCGNRQDRPPGPTQGYTGLSDINDLTDASSLIYTHASTDNNSEGALYFGTKAVKGCNNEGMLVFSQAGHYGVLDFVGIDDSEPWTTENPWPMTINWWLGDPGVTDFSQAPDNP